MKTQTPGTQEICGVKAELEIYNLFDIHANEFTLQSIIRVLPTTNNLFFIIRP